MKYELNVLFVLRKAQSDKKGLAPIFINHFDAIYFPGASMLIKNFYFSTY